MKPILYGGIKHLKTVLCFSLMNFPMKGQWRYVFAKWGGVKLVGNQLFIGKDVTFDTVHPDHIIIHNHVHITAGVVFLTHYLDTTCEHTKWIGEGNIEVCEGAFIGTNTIISKPVRIGRFAIVGAGSVVTKDIPDGEIWAGNPAKFIKKRTNEKD